MAYDPGYGDGNGNSGGGGSGGGGESGGGWDFGNNYQSNGWNGEGTNPNDSQNGDSGGGGGSEFEDFMKQLMGDKGSDYFGGYDPNTNTTFWGGNAAMSNPEDLAKAMWRDTQALQDASDENFNRNKHRENQWEGFLDSIQGRAESQLIDIKDVNEYDSVKEAKKSRDEFNDMSAQNMSAAASGIQGRMQGEMSRISNGRRADGTRMTLAEQQMASHQLQGMVGTQTQQALTPMVNAWNQQKAQMGMQVANVMGAAEQDRLRAQQHNAGIVMGALQLEAQGRQGLAQYTMMNKRNVVSIFQAMMKLTQAGMDMADYRRTHQSQGPHYFWDTNTVNEYGY